MVIKMKDLIKNQGDIFRKKHMWGIICQNGMWGITQRSDMWGIT